MTNKLKQFVDAVEAQEALGKDMICIPREQLESVKSVAKGLLRGQSSTAGGRPITNDTPKAAKAREATRRWRANRKKKEDE